MKELQEEAENYADKYTQKHDRKIGFFDGATSKYAEKQKLEYAIKQLKQHAKHNVIPFLNRIDIISKIKEIEQKLIELNKK
jgi:hypothetical protein